MNDRGDREYARLANGRPEQASVIAETAIALSYNGQSYAVMMATPCDLVDFALGFSLTEGLIEHADELQFIEVQTRSQGLVLELALPERRFQAMTARLRRHPGNSACGLCGTEDLAQAMRVPKSPLTQPMPTQAAITDALNALPFAQPLNQATGGGHAAAWCDAHGLLVREDVGRHNAFDKMVGARWHAGRASHAGFALLSSRLSYELVHKAAMAGISTLVAISAPTSAAIDLAESCGINLVAFARAGEFNVYAGKSADRMS